MNNPTKNHVELAWIENGKRPVTLEQVAHTAALDESLHTGEADEKYRAAVARRRIRKTVRNVSFGTIQYATTPRKPLDELPLRDRKRLVQKLATLVAQGEIVITQKDDDVRYEPSASEQARYMA